MKGALQRALRRMGYAIVRSGPRWGALEHEPVHPLATYSPWNADALFLETYERIRDATLVDKYRCYELWTLVEQVRKLSGDLLEVGAWRGGSGALIARKARLCGIRDRVYLCDTFAGIVKAGPRDPVFRDGDLGDASAQMVERLVYERMLLDNVTILAGAFPDQTGSALADATFRFCHIDVDVYRSASDVTEWIWGRLVVGGVLVYDDYGFQGCRGVTECVDQQRRMGDRMVIHNLNGHALVIKIK